MAVVLDKPYTFGTWVIAEGEKGIVVESNNAGFSVQFVKGKKSFTWTWVKLHPEKVKLSK